MATLYLRHGETFNGDGTSPNAATSEGGEGAFNNMGTIYAGTQAGITSGDDLIVFTGGSPTWNLSGTWSFSGNKMIFDSGTSFGGAFGVFTFAASTSINLKNSKIDGNGVFRITQSSSTHATNSFEGSQWSGVHFEDVATQNHSGWRRTAVSAARWVDVTMTLKGSGSLSTVQPLFLLTSTNTQFHFSGLTVNWNTTKSVYLFSTGAVTLIGTNFTLNGDHSGLRFSNYSGRGLFQINGVYLENGLAQLNTQTTTLGDGAVYSLSNISKGSTGFFDSYYQDHNIVREIHVDKNYPALNAYAIDSSNTKFSAKIVPNNIDSITKLLSTIKFDTVGGIRSVNVNLLLPSDYVNVLNSEYYAIVSYMDTDGTRKIKRSKVDKNPLPQSSDNWSAVVYGAENFTRYKVSISGINVKQETLLSVEVFTIRPKLDTTDIYFVDPEIELL